MYDVRNILARNNAIGRGAYASTTGAGVAEELFDEDGFSYKELLQEYSGDQKKSSKRQSDSNRNRQQDNNHSQSLSLRSYSKRNTASASELLNGLALKNNAYIQTIGTAASLSNTKLSSSESNAKSEDMSNNKVVSKVDTLSPDSDVYFNDVTVLRSAPSEANRENWLAGYAGKATLVSTSEADGVQWAAVRTGSGKLAYVSTDELSAANPLVTATGSRDKRNVDIGTMLGVKNIVKLYKDTDEQSDYSGDYGDETGLEVLERKIKNGEEWVKVKTYSNDVGWCKAEQLCPLEEKLHTINNSSGDGYKLNLNVGAIPRSMIPSDLNVDADGNIECKISAAYLKNSVNAHVFYDESGIAHGTKGAEAFDLSELNNTEIVGTAGFTPDGWVNFKLSDGRTITINMADLNTNIEAEKTDNTKDVKDLIINNRPDLSGPNYLMLGPTEKGSLIEVSEYSTTKADFAGNVSPAENGLEILVPVKDNNGKEYNVPIKLKVDEYDDGYILSLNVPKEEMIDESGNKFRVDFNRGSRHTTSISFDKDGNFDKQATPGYSMSMNVRYGDSNDYQRVELDFSGLNIKKSSVNDNNREHNIRITINGAAVIKDKKTEESNRELSVEQLEEIISRAQSEFENINTDYDRAIKVTERLNFGNYRDVGYIFEEENQRHIEPRFHQLGNTQFGVFNLSVGDNIKTEISSYNKSVVLEVPQIINGKEIHDIYDNDEIKIFKSAYISMKIEDGQTETKIYPAGDRGLNIGCGGNNPVFVYGSDYGDGIDINGNVTYYAGIGENSISVWESKNNIIYATQGFNTINIRCQSNDKESIIKSGGDNVINVYENNNGCIVEDFTESDVVCMKGKLNSSNLKLIRNDDGTLSVMDGINMVIKLSGNYNLDGKIMFSDMLGTIHEMTLNQIKMVESNFINRGEQHMQSIMHNGSYQYANGMEINILDEEDKHYLETYGYRFPDGIHISRMNVLSNIDEMIINNATETMVEMSGLNSFVIDGSASMSIKDNYIPFIRADDNIHLAIVGNDVVAQTGGGDNKIKLNAYRNQLILGDGNNEVEIGGVDSKIRTSNGKNMIKVDGKNAYINCGVGEDSIILKSTGTTISNFNFDKDKLSFGSYSELEAEVQGRAIVVKRKNSNSRDFVVSLLGTTDIDKIQKIIEKHNEIVQKDEMSRKLTESYASLESSLAEKIGTAIKNDVEPVFEAKDALKQIDKIGKIEGSTHLPQNVIDRYKGYVAESMANSAITADDLTNTERIVNSWASIFGDDKEIPIGEYTIVPTAISYNGIGAFKADVKKDGKYVTTLYMSNLDNKALSEAVTDFIAAGQKVYKSKLNEAIKSYVDEVGDAFGVNLGESYDIGVGVINLLSGGNAGKSKFSKMLNSFGQKNVEKLIERTFGREGKNMIKAVRSLKDAKDNIDSAINTANLTDYEKITGLLNATAKLIGKL